MPFDRDRGPSRRGFVAIGATGGTGGTGSFGAGGGSPGGPAHGSMSAVASASGAVAPGQPWVGLSAAGSGTGMRVVGLGASSVMGGSSGRGARLAPS